MLEFDRLYLEKLASFHMEPVLYQRYIDDLNMAISSVDPGLVYEEGKLVMKPELVSVDSETSEDKRTASLLKNIANSIMPGMIIMEEDTGSEHPNGKLPVLDMEFWIEKNEIYHQFYKKPMATRQVIMARSALSTSQKRSILVQEGLLDACQTTAHLCPGP